MGSDAPMVNTSDMGATMAAQLFADALPHSTGASRMLVRDRFYLWVALGCGAIAIFGFLPTYWLQLSPRTFVGAPILHIHAVLCTA